MAFSMGSSTPSGVPGGDPHKTMDMSLDDIIKSRGKVRRTPRKGAGKKNTTAALATGQNTARRNAGIAARRGITNNKNPNAMEVDRQVSRQQTRGVGRTGGPRNQGGRGTARGAAGRGRGGARPTAPSAAAVRAKARKLAGVKSPVSAIAAPTQQAIGAAAKAMKDHGFKLPKGMQMQISFIPKAGARTNAQNEMGNANRNTGSGGGRGGGGRGGRGGRGGYQGKGYILEGG